MFESIQKGLREAIDFAEGQPIQAVVYDISPLDVKEVREHVGMTQAEFAAVFGVVAKEPKAVLRALSERSTIF